MSEQDRQAAQVGLEVQAQGEPDGGGQSRQRLLAALETVIQRQTFNETRIADIVKEARTSRRTFYEYFANKEACLIALHVKANQDLAKEFSEGMEPGAPWQEQVRQAVETGLAFMDVRRGVMRSWVRDVPALGEQWGQIHEELTEMFVIAVQRLLSLIPEHGADGAAPVSRQRAVFLLGGLEKLTLDALRREQPFGDLADEAVGAVLALLDPAGKPDW